VKAVALDGGTSRSFSSICDIDGIGSSFHGL
jgi:hypothetical protein